MFTKIRQAIRPGAPTPDGGAWLDESSNGFVYTFRMKLKPDAKKPPPLDVLFNADAIWGGQGGMAGGLEATAGVDPSKRLRDALGVHRKKDQVVDAEGHSHLHHLVFSDVVVWLPTALWKKDADKNGADIGHLAHELKDRHRTTFGERDRLHGRPPSYVVLPTDAFGADEVAFQFGLGVFVPSDADKPLAGLEARMSHEELWRGFPDWVFFEAGKRKTRSCVFYQGQEYLALGATPLAAPVRPACGWFPHGEGLAVIRLDEAGFAALAIGEALQPATGVLPDSPPGGAVLGFECQDQSDPETAGEALLIRLTPLSSNKPREAEIRNPSSPDKEGAGPHRPEGEKKGRTVGNFGPHAAKNGADSPMKGQTVIGRRAQQAESRATGPRLVVEGIALPNSRGCPSIKSWKLWVDVDGNIALGAVTPEQQEEHFGICQNSNGSLMSRPKGMVSWKPVVPHSPPVRLDSGFGHPFTLEPGPDPRMFHGILRLSAAAFHPIDKEVTVLGRNDPEGKVHADFKLDFLNAQGCVEWADADLNGTPFSAYEMSRKHAELTLSGSAAEIKSIGQGATYVKPPGGNWTQLERNHPTALRHDHQIMMGLFVTRLVLA